VRYGMITSAAFCLPRHGSVTRNTEQFPILRTDSNAERDASSR
jgi:hypothetical protein